MKKVILLDVDGVLVTPGGYRAAVSATFKYFARLMGVPNIEIQEEQIVEMERRGIMSEWDMVPILLGALWNDILSQWNNASLPSDLVSAALETGRGTNGDTPTQVRVPAFDLKPDLFPAEAAYQQGCFPFLPDALRRSLLYDTRNVHTSQTTRLFQQYSLGSRIFNTTYDLPAEIETESFLHLYDVSNLSKSVLAKLHQEDVCLATITARPSAPPRDVETSPVGYAPEAEIALNLVGLPDMPLIGLGSLDFLARQRGMSVVSLMKPSPVHALAAIGAACTGLECSAIQAAADWYATGKISDMFSRLPRSFELVIVEDTLNGIRSTLRAGEMLRQAGFDVTVHPFGLTMGNAPKGEMFEKEGIPYFEDWESLTAAIGL